MTRLGQMLYEDGVAIGEERGERMHLIMLVKKKMEKGKTLDVIAEEVESDVETIAVIVREMGEVQKQGKQQNI